MMSLIVTLPKAPTSADSVAFGRIADGVKAAAPPSVPVVHEIRAQSTTAFTLVIALRRMPARRAASRSTLPIGHRPDRDAGDRHASRSEPSRSGTEPIGTPAMPMPATVFVAVFTPAQEPPAFWIAAHQLEAPGGGICESVASPSRIAGKVRLPRIERGKAALGDGQGLELLPPRRVRVDVRERQGLDRDVRPEQRPPSRSAAPTAGSRPGRPSRSGRPRARRSRSGRSPIGTEPMGTEPIGTEPIGTEPMGTLPIGTLPIGTEPIGIEPTGPVPGEPENAGSCEPGTADSGTSCAATGRTRRSLVSSIVGSASPLALVGVGCGEAEVVDLLRARRRRRSRAGPAGSSRPPRGRRRTPCASPGSSTS